MRLQLFELGLPLLLAATSVKAYGKTRDSDMKTLEYLFGDRIEVSCLNRSIDTGEHIQDEKTGALQYIPFATCNETNLPLSFDFNRDSREGKEMNCTIPFLSDEMFHLLEFYIHHDSPLACRVPARPLGGDYDVGKVSPGGVSESGQFVPLIISIAGKLEFSHLHIANQLNVIFHLSSPGVVDSATAYSTSPLTQATRIIIGDSLTLRFTVRWYASTALPSLRSGRIEDEESALWPLILLIIVVGGLAAAAITLLRRRGKGSNPMGGIIGNEVNNGGANVYGNGGYGDAGYGGFKGVAVRGGSSGGSNGYGYGYGYGYGGFSGKRKD